MKYIDRTKVIYAMSPDNKAAARVQPNNAVTFQTHDCFGGQIKSEEQKFEEIGWDRINPATGPLFVEGASPGDVLAVDIVDIRILEQGVMVAAPKLGVLKDYFSKSTTKIIPIQEGKAVFDEKIEIPISPMIGVIGTAPKAESIPCGTPGDHGGNMDCKRIERGTTLYLPVNVPGGLLAMGDLHAVMGDGEILICGLEIAGEVDVRLRVLPSIALPMPVLENDKVWMTIASAETLDEAAEKATKTMFELMTSAEQISFEDAGMLMSMAGQLQICQVVDPLKTARFEMPKEILAKLGISLL